VKESIENLGSMVMETIDRMGGMLRLCGATVTRMPIPPFRARLVFSQLDQIGFGSIFIVSLTGFFTGMVFALNSLNALTELQAEGMVAPSMTLALTRELGPILTGLLVAGRTGSAIATEIGTMRVTEQIDAMEMMGVDPIKYLVVPRAIALVVCLPLLNAMFVFTGIYGSIIAAEPFGISASLFIQEALRMVDANDFWIGTIKMVAFGLMIAAVSAYEGMAARGGAKGVGMSATRSVVITSLMVLALDWIIMLLLAPVMLDFDL
jgi:phospholipid/cholesterol/gamma-HCH transport system permease protein|tara:strand:+ start:303 stop:1094 length:792 start_codon:yes stop_codon:yes gene_type:complete